MKHRIGCKIFTQVAVEGGECVGRGKALLKQQPHRIAFVTKAGLDRDEDIPELFAEHED